MYSYLTYFIFSFERKCIRTTNNKHCDQYYAHVMLRVLKSTCYIRHTYYFNSCCYQFLAFSNSTNDAIKNLSKQLFTMYVYFPKRNKFLKYKTIHIIYISVKTPIRTRSTPTRPSSPNRRNSPVLLKNDQTISNIPFDYNLDAHLCL